MENTKRSYIYAILAILFWSTIPTAFKICLSELAILPMLTIASATSAVTLLVIVMAEKKTGRLKINSGSDIFNSALLGLLNQFLY